MRRRPPLRQLEGKALDDADGVQAPGVTVLDEVVGRNEALAGTGWLAMLRWPL